MFKYFYDNKLSDYSWKQSDTPYRIHNCMFSGFVAMLVAFYSYRSYKISRDASMIGLTMGFTFLMLGLVMRALLFILAMDMFSRPGALLIGVALGKAISDLSTLFAYLPIAIGCTFSLRKFKESVPLVIIIPARVFLERLVSWIMEFVSFLFLLYVSVIIMTRYLQNKDTLTLQVLSAFILLLSTNVLMIMSVYLSSIIILRFLAFLLFLLAVSFVGRK